MKLDLDNHAGGLAQGPDAWIVPKPDRASREFWDGAQRGVLVIQKCRHCTKLQHPPNVMCRWCGSREVSGIAQSGRGVVYSFVIIERPFHVAFVALLPYVLAEIELVEQSGLRLISNVVGSDPKDIRVGDEVEVDFVERLGVSVPVFRKSGIRR